ncbi:questin oxidase family protein [Amycolatopsis sp. TNS106]|uniref:questin oxidase family protein n=1 Tax=Amycolatopsis sp. TNS106 TaxID=2861750 RepID=UPI001C579DDD|nr:questin oxidase family protein [Amycolatopsis sp. TNS106]QXV56619.1 hypothetical protein CVV72_06060 [Amycolatopsis sp. TNS106]
MGLVLTAIYLVGMITSAGVGRFRAGISQGGRMSILTIVRSMPWFLNQMASMLLWPAFLGTWLARGRPKTPWQAITTGDGTIMIRRKTR